MPVPTSAQAREIAAQIEREHGHESDDVDEAWNLEHATLWPGVSHDFHWQQLGTTIHRPLPLPTDTKHQERWIRALTRLVRLALRHGHPEDLAGMWFALDGVTSQSGDAEIMHDGIMHPGLLHVCLEWTQMHKVYQERGGLMPPINVQAFTDLHLTMVLHETIVRDGLIFIASLAMAASGQRTTFWDKLVRLKGNNAYVPYFDEALGEVLPALHAMPRRRGFNRTDRQALKDFVNTLGRSGVWPKRTNLSALRDNVAHGKYDVDYYGMVHLDTYEHWAVNRFHLTTPGRIGYRTHPYKYRTVTARAARSMLSMACSLAVVFWATYHEFQRGLPGKVGVKTPSAPRTDMLVAAAQKLVGIDPGLKEEEIAKELRRMRRLRNRVKVKATLVRVRSKDAPRPPPATTDPAPPAGS